MLKTSLQKLVCASKVRLTNVCFSRVLLPKNARTQQLPSYHERKRSVPALLASSSSDMTTAIHEDQTSSDTDEQIIPGLSVWVLAKAHLPKFLTIIGYYPMINAPITDLKTIQECMRCNQEGSTEAGQEHTISTFDLGVCVKADME